MQGQLGLLTVSENHAGGRSELTLKSLKSRTNNVTIITFSKFQIYIDTPQAGFENIVNFVYYSSEEFYIHRDHSNKTLLAGRKKAAISQASEINLRSIKFMIAFAYTAS